MDNHEGKDDELNKRPDSEGETPKEDIPLWLQGIEESAPDETKPIEPTGVPKGSWIREVDDNISDPMDDHGDDLSEYIDPDTHEFETEIEHGDFDNEKPDHELNVESNQDVSLVDDFIDVTDDLESTEEIDIQTVSDRPFLKEIEPDFDPTSSDDGFVDISGVGLPEQPLEAEALLDDEHLSDGELPEWLQEMIAESEQEPETDELVPDDDLDLGQVPQEIVPDLIDTEENTFAQDELSQQDEVLPPSEHQYPESVPDYAITIAEEDTTPISLYTDEAHPSPQEEELSIPDEERSTQDELPQSVDEGGFDQDSTSSEEEQLVELEVKDAEIPVTDNIHASFENAQDDENFLSADEETRSVDEKPDHEEINTLDRAKYFIGEGQIDEALPIINNLIEDPDHLEQLEVMLRELAGNEANASSAVMETLGDIALKQHKAQDALDAYVKAIKLLLENEEVLDEIG